MPVKISNSTSIQTGEITDLDRKKMKNDFIADTAISPLHGRINVIKKFAWYVTKEEVLSLFDLNSDSSGNPPALLEINFALNLQGLADQCGNDMSDSLTVVLEVTNNDKEPVDPKNEYVLIPGFNHYNNDLLETKLRTVFGGDCCPSSNP